MRLLGLSLCVMVAAGVRAAEPSDVTGSWTVAVEVGERTIDRMLSLEYDDQGFKGTWSVGRQVFPLERISYAEGKLYFRMLQKTPDGLVEFSFEAGLEAGRLIGTLSGAYGSSAVVGERGRPIDPTIRRPPGAHVMSAKRAAGRTAPARAAPAASEPVATAAGSTPLRDAPPGTLMFRAHNERYRAEGRFARWRFTRVVIPEGDLTRGEIDFEIELASVEEKSASLAEHLRSDDFFAVASHPLALVQIRGAKLTEAGDYSAAASVDFHGHVVTVPLVFRVVTKAPLAIEGTAVLSRAAFALGADFSGISDDVTIELKATLPNE